VEEKLALRVVRTAVDRGINFMDNSWDYNEGAVTQPDSCRARPGFPVTRNGFEETAGLGKPVRSDDALRQSEKRMDKRSAMAKVGPPNGERGFRNGENRRGGPKGKPAGRSSIQVACLDLVQHHEIIRFDDAHRIFDPDGANAAFAPRSDLISSKE